MMTETASQQVWAAGNAVVVLTRDKLFAQHEFAAAARDKAAAGARAAAEPHKALGRLAKSVPVDKISRVDLVPSLGLLVVRRTLHEPIRIQLNDEPLARDLFDTLRGRVGGETPLESRRASVNDVPLDPRLLAGVLFGLFGIGALASGAFTHDGVPAGRQAAKFAWLIRIGESIGPMGFYGIAAMLLSVGIGAIVYWWKSLPDKVYFLAK